MIAVEKVRQLKDVSIDSGVTFDEWMQAVDTVMRHAFEITSRDIGDHLWKDMFEAGMTVFDAMFEALEDDDLI